mmetsp:Transcript_5370/g.16253  ORF Transcript_5370/g.16253 Transcript_5370/m.16253 type:complete len:196 (-) Transcript_5370:174-761(-)
MVSTPHGAKLLRATTGEGAKDAKYVADDLLKVLAEVGAEKVVCVVTDSASVNEKAMKIVTENHKHITWVRCTAHAINLIFKDIGKLSWADEVVSNARKVVKFIRRYTRTRSMYRKCVRALPVGAEGRNLELFLPADTRFGSNVVLCDRMLKVREALTRVVSDPDWDSWCAEKNLKIRSNGLEVSALVRTMASGLI